MLKNDNDKCNIITHYNILFNNVKLMKFFVVYIFYKIFDIIIVPVLCDLF